jgi:putative colanic acid biosynthesis acetyltransferase WcaF
MGHEDTSITTGSASTPVIDLSDAPGERQAWDRSSLVVYLWAGVELLLVTNPWQISSRVRIAALRAFGAEIEQGVIFRPRTRVKFPWKLSIGKNAWIGEGVWIHNQDSVQIGHNVVISQETFLTTGSHAHRTDMALVTSPITIGAGSWITSRCIVLGGTSLGENCLITPGSVVSGKLAPGTKFGSPPGMILGERKLAN